MERKVVESSASGRRSSEEEAGILDKVKSVIGALASPGKCGEYRNSFDYQAVGGEERRTSDYSLINEEEMLPKVKEAFERIQREKAQSELLNEVQQHIIQNGGDLDADKAVEVLATKDNFEDVDIRTLTIGSSESTNPEQKTNDEGILEKVKSVAMLAIDALTADADEREKADENSRRSSSELNDEDKLLLEKIKKEKEQSELLNKVQKKKIRNLEQTFDPVQAQDNLRRQEQGKKKEKPVRKNSKSGCPREKSVDKKPVVAEGARVRKDSLKRADGSAKPKSRPTSRAPLPRA